MNNLHSIPPPSLALLLDGARRSKIPHEIFWKLCITLAEKHVDSLSLPDIYKVVRSIKAGPGDNDSIMISVVRVLKERVIDQKKDSEVLWNIKDSLQLHGYALPFNLTIPDPRGLRRLLDSGSLKFKGPQNASDESKLMKIGITDLYSG